MCRKQSSRGNGIQGRDFWVFLLWCIVSLEIAGNKKNTFLLASTIIFIFSSLQAPHIQEVFIAFQIGVIVLHRTPREIEYEECRLWNFLMDFPTFIPCDFGFSPWDAQSWMVSITKSMKMIAIKLQSTLRLMVDSTFAILQLYFLH